MSVAIIFFSPQGNTSKAGRMLKKSLETKGTNVQIINTARTDLFKSGNIRAFLVETVRRHETCRPSLPYEA